MVVPSMCWSVTAISNIKFRGVALFVLVMAAVLSDTVDAFIYVFKYKCVRALLIKKLPYIFYCCKVLTFSQFCHSYIIQVIYDYGIGTDIFLAPLSLPQFLIKYFSEIQ